MSKHGVCMAKQIRIPSIEAFDEQKRMLYRVMWRKFGAALTKRSGYRVTNT